MIYTLADRTLEKHYTRFNVFFYYTVQQHESICLHDARCILLKVLLTVWVMAHTAPKLHSTLRMDCLWNSRSTRIIGIMWDSKIAQSRRLWVCEDFLFAFATRNLVCTQAKFVSTSYVIEYSVSDTTFFLFLDSTMISTSTFAPPVMLLGIGKGKKRIY